MKILVDENIPWMTAEALRELGHDVRDVRGTTGEGVSDEALWGLAQDQGRLVITTDRGFASHRAEPHFGILLVRLRQPNRARIHRRVLQAVAEIDSGEWPGLLVSMRDTVMSTWRRATGTG
ncbi:MAG: DUF5615 family PIN-like protein [Armatimonadota bacterium]